MEELLGVDMMMSVPLLQRRLPCELYRGFSKRYGTDVISGCSGTRHNCFLGKEICQTMFLNELLLLGRLWK